VAVQALRRLAGRNQNRNTYRMTFIVRSDQVPDWSQSVTLDQDNWFEPQHIKVKHSHELSVLGLFDNVAA